MDLRGKSMHFICIRRGVNQENFATHVMRRERQGRRDPELTIEPK